MQQILSKHFLPIYKNWNNIYWRRTLVTPTQTINQGQLIIWSNFYIYWRYNTFTGAGHNESRYGDVSDWNMYNNLFTVN